MSAKTDTKVYRKMSVLIFPWKFYYISSNIPVEIVFIGVKITRNLVFGFYRAGNKLNLLHKEKSVSIL